MKDKIDKKVTIFIKVRHLRCPIFCLFTLKCNLLSKEIVSIKNKLLFVVTFASFVISIINDAVLRYFTWIKIFPEWAN